MNDLEQQNHLVPLIQGRLSTLSRQRQRLAATWAFKTVLMFAFLEPPERRCIPSAHYRDLYQLQQPPSPAVELWIGATKRAVGVWQHTRKLTLGLASGVSADGYGATLCVGHVVFQILGTEVEGGASTKIRGDLANVLWKIWPVGNYGLWPARVVLGTDDVPMLTEMFGSSL